MRIDGTRTTPFRRCWPRSAAGALSLALLAGCGAGPGDLPPVPYTELRAVDTPPPAYPLAVACDDIGGQVILEVTVGTEGRPGKIRVMRGSGTEALDVAAHEGVRHWRFTPATRGGQPIAKTLRVPVTFTPPTIRPDACFVLDEQRNR